MQTASMRAVRWILAPVLWAFLACGTGVRAEAPGSSYEALLVQAEAMRTSDLQQFQKLLAALELRTAEATPAQLEFLRYLQAYQDVYASNYAEAIGKATELTREATDAAMQFRAGLLLVTTFASTRDFAAGLSQLQRTLALGDQIADKDLRHRGWITAGVLYNQLGQYHLGLRSAERIQADDPGPRSRCFAGHLIAESQFHLGQTTGSEETLKSVIADCKAQGETVAAHLTRSFLVRHWAAAGKPALAIAELRTHLPEVEQSRYPHLIAIFHALLADYSLQQGDTAAAEQQAHRALASSESASFSMPRVSAWKTLYEVAQRQQDATAALEYYRNFAEADKAYLDDIKAREMAFQLAQLEAQQNEHTIELLNKQNQVLTLEQQVARQSARFNRLLVGVLVLLLLGIAYWAWKVKRVQNVFRHLAQIDALTGVHNRHHFHQQAEMALLKCAENRLVATLIMFDLDHFKSVNDNYGHATGDWVLKSVADTARGLCRDRDYIGRLGGEEFALLLISADLSAGMALAERCRALIAATDTGPSGHSFPISASFGVASTQAAGHDFRLLLAQSDNAVYRAKHRGRDQVCAFDETAERSGNAQPAASIAAAH